MKHFSIPTIVLLLFVSTHSIAQSDDGLREACLVGALPNGKNADGTYKHVWKVSITKKIDEKLNEFATEASACTTCEKTPGGNRNLEKLKALKMNGPSRASLSAGHSNVMREMAEKQSGFSFSSPDKKAVFDRAREWLSAGHCPYIEDLNSGKKIQGD